MKKLFITALLMSLFTLHTASADTLLMGDSKRGKALHDKSCSACHVSMFGGDGNEIYKRKDRKIATIEGLMARVEGCNKNVGTNFDKAQIDDVVKYLSDEFYKFTAPEKSKMEGPKK